MNTLESEQSVTRAQPFIRKILVAVDLRSDATAEYAAYIAKCLGAWLKLVYVHPSETVYNFISTDGFDFIAMEKGVRRYALSTLTKRMLKRYPFCSQAFLEGNPAEEIALFARKINADLIILDSHHPNFFEGLIHLDQALQVMRKAHCPVLIFREKGVRKSSLPGVRPGLVGSSMIGRDRVASPDATSSAFGPGPRTGLIPRNDGHVLAA